LKKGPGGGGFTKEYWDENYAKPEEMDNIGNRKLHLHYLKSFLALEFTDISSVMDFGFGLGHLFEEALKEFKPYKAYGIERSMARSAYSVFRHFVSWVLGIKIIGAEGLKKNLQNPSDIMPADFLIDEQGYIIETYYGSDASDHIPFENIYKFLNADQNPK